jgi:hypothetical protein
LWGKANKCRTRQHFLSASMIGSAIVGTLLTSLLGSMGSSMSKGKKSELLFVPTLPNRFSYLLFRLAAYSRQSGKTAFPLQP